MAIESLKILSLQHKLLRLLTFQNSKAHVAELGSFSQSAINSLTTCTYWQGQKGQEEGQEREGQSKHSTETRVVQTCILKTSGICACNESPQEEGAHGSEGQEGCSSVCLLEQVHSIRFCADKSTASDSVQISHLSMWGSMWVLLLMCTIGQMVRTNPCPVPQKGNVGYLEYVPGV